MDTNRTFTIEGLGEYKIVTPSAEAIKKSDWNYSKVYNQAMVDGLFTQGEMTDILKKRGIIGTDYDTRGEQLKASIGEKIVAMELEADKDKRRVLAVDVAKIRQEIFDHNQLVNGPLSNTCEQLAEDARVDYLTSIIVRNKDGSLVWADYATYLKEENRGLAFRARFEVMLFMQGLDPDFLDRVPENIVMKEILEEERKAIEEKSVVEDTVVVDETVAEPVVEKKAKIKKVKDTSPSA